MDILEIRIVSAYYKGVYVMYGNSIGDLSRNRFQHILNNMSSINDLDEEQKVKRIKKIMSDVEATGAFNFGALSDVDFDDDLEFQADMAFCNTRKTATIVDALETVKGGSLSANEIFNETSAERIRRKQLELGIDPDTSPEEEEITTRYGRSPLHEAVARRCLDDVKRYAAIGKYLDSTDNNGQTPLQFAQHIGYVEAAEILKKAS